MLQPTRFKASTGAALPAAVQLACKAELSCAGAANTFAVQTHFVLLQPHSPLLCAPGSAACRVRSQHGMTLTSQCHSHLGGAHLQDSIGAAQHGCQLSVRPGGLIHHRGSLQLLLSAPSSRRDPNDLAHATLLQLLAGSSSCRLECHKSSETGSRHPQIEFQARHRHESPAQGHHRQPASAPSLFNAACCHTPQDSCAPVPTHAALHYGSSPLTLDTLPRADLPASIARGASVAQCTSSTGTPAGTGCPSIASTSTGSSGCTCRTGAGHASTVVIVLHMAWHRTPCNMLHTAESTYTALGTIWPGVACCQHSVAKQRFCLNLEVAELPQRDAPAWQPATYLPCAVKRARLPVEAHQLLPAARDTGGPDGAAVQGQARCVIAGSLQALWGRGGGCFSC